jgi:hypothetical protein
VSQQCSSASGAQSCTLVYIANSAIDTPSVAECNLFYMAHNCPSAHSELPTAVESQRSNDDVTQSCPWAILDVSTAHSLRVHCIAAHFVAAAAALCMHSVSVGTYCCQLLCHCYEQCACMLCVLRCRMSVVSGIKHHMCATCTRVVLCLLVRLSICYMQYSPGMSHSI